MNRPIPQANLISLLESSATQFHTHTYKAAGLAIIRHASSREIAEIAPASVEALLRAICIRSSYIFVINSRREPSGLLYHYTYESIYRMAFWFASTRADINFGTIVPKAKIPGIQCLCVCICVRPHYAVEDNDVQRAGIPRIAAALWSSHPLARRDILPFCWAIPLFLSLPLILFSGFFHSSCV